MMAVPLPASSSLYSLAFGSSEGRGFHSPVKRTLGWSLLLHLGVFLVVLALSWKSSADRPLGSAVQVSLVSLPPTPKVAPTKAAPKPQPAPKVEPAPQPKVEMPKPVTLPVPPVKASVPTPAPVAAAPAPPVPQRAPLPPEPVGPASAPLPSIPRAKSLPPPPTLTPPKSARSAPRTPTLPPQPTLNAARPSPRTDNPFRGALKDIDLPREAPKFGDLTPERPKPVPPKPVAQQKAQPSVPDRTQQEVQSLLEKLKVPEQKRVVLPSPPIEEARETPPQRRLEEDFVRDQEKVKQKLQQDRQRASDLPKPTKFETAEVKTADTRPTLPEREEKPAPATTASLSQSRPDMNIQVEGAGGNVDPYFTQVVQPRIASHWDGTQVDMPAGTAVIIGLRLARDGTIMSVELKRSSGNDYYDMAALRAVRATQRVPPVPKHLTKPYYDIDYSFAFRGQTG
ncbi:hypothetical protein YTPLAS18_27780 [Nitrospira sp.]|nr:hypothetical protein YTPLAS18_27780 [Nitrospira sp.]